MPRPFPFAALLALTLSAACGPDPAPTPPGPTGYTDPPPYGTPFTGLAAPDDRVLYEVNLRAFPGGDFDGVIGRLDAIAELGVNVLWLMPHYPIGVPNSVNSPYSVADYTAVSGEYGTLDDLRRLTGEAHARGMAVILDWVANHTAWDHPWITEHPDWYTQVGGEIVHPPGTGWLDVADLNFERDSMQVAMIRALKYWVLAANVDGYRCDAADFVPFAFWDRALDTLRAMPGRRLLMLAEGARANHLSAGFDLNFGWDWYATLKEVFVEGAPVGELLEAHADEYAALGTDHHRLRFTTNHDESAWDACPPTLFGGQDPALAAFAATLCTGGVPLLYGSQEVGRTGTLPFFSNSAIDWSAHPEVRAAYGALMDAYTAGAAWRSGALEDHGTDDVLIVQRATAADTALVLVNTRDAAASAPLPPAWRGRPARDALSGGVVALDSAVALAPWAYRLLERP